VFLLTDFCALEFSYVLTDWKIVFLFTNWLNRCSRFEGLGQEGKTDYCSQKSVPRQEKTLLYCLSKKAKVLANGISLTSGDFIWIVRREESGGILEKKSRHWNLTVHIVPQVK